MCVCVYACECAYMYKNNENTEWTKFQGFTDWEAGKLKRIVEMLVWQLEKGTTKWEKKSRLARERFYAFVNEYDMYWFPFPISRPFNSLMDGFLKFLKQ